MALNQQSKKTKEAEYMQEDVHFRYKMPSTSHMKRTYVGPSTSYQPDQYQPSELQNSVLREPVDTGGHWYTMMLTKNILGVAESKVWHGTADICDTEKQEYVESLAKVRHDARELRIEVMFCARLDLIKRFKAAHNFLCDNHGVDYTAPEFHTDCLDNLLLCAVFFSAYKVVDYLMQIAGRHLRMASCNTPIFHGGTTLHVAIIRGCSTLVRTTMEGLNEEDRLEVLNTFGDGDFFPTTASCYSVPLLLALQTGRIQIFIDLVGFGGDPTVTDPHNGNGIIHAINLYGRREPDKAVEMFHDILNHEAMKRWYCKCNDLDYCKFSELEAIRMRQLLLRTENLAGYSPLAHAAVHGVYPMLQALLQTEGVYKQSIWSMGSSSLCNYDMIEVDPTVRDLTGRCRPTVLELLLYERTEDNIPVLTMEPLRDLMRSKWETWKLVFICWGLWHLVTISSYSIYSILQHIIDTGYANPDNVAGLNNNTHMDYASRHPVFWSATRINVWILVSLYILLTITDTISSLQLYVCGRLLRPGSGYYYVPWSVIRKFDDFNVHCIIFTILTSLSLLRVFSRQDIHAVVTGFGIMEGWYFLLFFTRAFRHTSLFTVVTNRMFRLDLLRFGIIAFIHIISFSSCLLVLLAPHLPQGIASIFEAPQTMFLVMVGLTALQYLLDPSIPWVAKIVGIAFIITATVLLLNLLIAAMGDTYAGISENKECIWLKMRVRSVLILDRFLHFSVLRRCMMGHGLIYKRDSRRWILRVDNMHMHANISVESLWDSIVRSFTTG